MVGVVNATWNLGSSGVRVEASAEIKVVKVIRSRWWLLKGCVVKATWSVAVDLAGVLGKYGIWRDQSNKRSWLKGWHEEGMKEGWREDCGSMERFGWRGEGRREVQ